MDAYERDGHRWEVLPYAGPIAVCEVKHRLNGVCNQLVTHLCVYTPSEAPRRTWRRCAACAAAWVQRQRT